MAGEIKKKYPLASKYIGKVRAIFEEYDKDKDEKLSLNEVAIMFENLSKKVTSLPAVCPVVTRRRLTDCRLPKSPVNKANISVKCSPNLPNPPIH